MGRYYSGDIEGKFWFGVQDSNDANHFGVEMGDDNSYHFSNFDVIEVIFVLKGILSKLKEIREKHKTSGLLFEGDDQDILEARFELGWKIKKCIEEKGKCNFEVEI